MYRKTFSSNNFIRNYLEIALSHYNIEHISLPPLHYIPDTLPHTGIPEAEELVHHVIVIREDGGEIGQVEDTGVPSVLNKVLHTSQT